MDIDEIVEATGEAIEIVGVVVIIIGGLYATYRFAGDLTAPRSNDVYPQYRRRLGRAIILGLEFLVAGDIIRTVAVDPTFEQLGILAGIVAIRTALAFSLELEITGRWPWQASKDR